MMEMANADNPRYSTLPTSDLVRYSLGWIRTRRKWLHKGTRPAKGRGKWPLRFFNNLQFEARDTNFVS